MTSLSNKTSISLLLILLSCIHLSISIPFTSNLDCKELRTRNGQIIPIPPDQDEFYAAPSNLSSYKPGDIIRTRPVVNSINFFNTAATRLAGAYQILFRTSDSNGHIEAAVTTLLIPHAADPTKLLSYQPAEDSANSTCAPSIAIQIANDTNSYSSVEYLFVQAALLKSWYVVVPDFEGPKSAFCSGAQAGHATLDSIRAVLKSGGFSGIASKPNIGLWGYSGGAFASGWALEIAASYAPELSFVGAALGGTVNNIGVIFNTLNKGLLAGLAPTALLGIAADYADWSSALENELIPATAAAFKAPLTQCNSANNNEFLGQDITSYFKSGPAFLNQSITQLAFARVNVGKHVPDTPMYIYKAIHDEVSPIAQSDSLVDFYCAGGASVEYKRDSASGHIALAVTGAGDALAWLEGRINGTSAPIKGCTNETVVSTLSDPVGSAALGEIVLPSLTNIYNVIVQEGLAGSK